ncbi:MAG: hypothetical protein HQQ73_08220 [Desulfobulbaceae bacterium]|nr:hypothetical protein [Desulfobulbaceae bacterium]
MSTLFSYVVDHDHGFAPNPYNGICTLVHCKFRHTDGKRRNIVELAQKDDWILGSGGASRQSAGQNKIIYLMRVDEQLPFADYLRDTRFNGRQDHYDGGYGNEFALVSHHYFYFGKNALSSSVLPPKIHVQNLFKTEANYRRDLPDITDNALISWFETTFEVGMHGDPCTSTDNSIQPRFRSTTAI